MGQSLRSPSRNRSIAWLLSGDLSVILLRSGFRQPVGGVTPYSYVSVSGSGPWGNCWASCSQMVRLAKVPTCPVSRFRRSNSLLERNRPWLGVADALSGSGVSATSIRILPLDMVTTLQVCQIFHAELLRVLRAVEYSPCNIRRCRCRTSYTHCDGRQPSQRHLIWIPV